MKTTKEYNIWLAQKMVEHKISRDYLLGLMIILERVLEEEKYKLTGRRLKPFYNLRNGEGGHSRAWLHASELALWLKYKGYKPVDWFRSTCAMPAIKRRLKHKEQIPINMIMPSTRNGSARLREAEDNYRVWIRHSYTQTPSINPS